MSPYLRYRLLAAQQHSQTPAPPHPQKTYPTTTPSIETQHPRHTSSPPYARPALRPATLPPFLSFSSSLSNARTTRTSRYEL